MGFTNDRLSILVTISRECPSEKVKDVDVQAVDVQLLSLFEASVRVIADTIIKEKHPWNTNEVFDFFGLGFKPLPESVVLAYKKYIDQQ